MNYRGLFLSLTLISSLPVFSQPDHPHAKAPSASTAESRWEAVEARKASLENSLVGQLHFRSAGPTVMSGRVTDLAVDPKDPTHFYAAYASGGLWETKNNGISFEPLFDREAVMTIGDVAVNWETGTIWIGSGENNSSRSSYSGLGLFRSDDGGKTWEAKGLSDSHHIGRIVLHPTNPDILWVASLGHLYSANTERGIFMSTDGGNSWQRTLDVNPNSGAIDLVIGERTAEDPKLLYASIWHRERRAWNFVEAGSGSGIYRSTDGGLSWEEISTAESGFPYGEGVGRIGLAVGSDDGQVVYALVDNQFREEEEPDDDKSKALTKDDLRTMSKADFLALADKKVKGYLQDNGFPEKYDVDKVKAMIKEDEITPLALVEYLEDGNALLFDTPVKGAELYRSTDGGKTWKLTHEDPLDDVYYSYGYYFGLVRCNPSNADQVYIAGVPILRSDDGGKTFESMNGDNVHVDHHALWINPDRPGHLINGNDGGVNISYDNGDTWFKANAPAVGQFYTVAVDNAKPYRIFGGLQDNGVWMGSSSYQSSSRWQQEGQYPYRRIMGGDGMQVAIDSRNNNTAYTGYQFGHYFRINLTTNQQEYITPHHDLGERPLRFNWQTPIHLSVHNQDILYMGSNKFHRSMNRGDDMETLSDDLTMGGIKGDVPYGTLSSIHESPLRFGLLYVGSDDGLIHVSKDGGYTWEKISEALPSHLWVSRIQASAHDEGTVYTSLNGYRWDNFKAYLYRSPDYGKSWVQIGRDLPDEPINVVKEDPVNPNILYVGTDHGIYVSLDKGQHFMAMDNELPSVAIHDLVIHPRDNELILATHGRSLYVAPVAHLQALTEDVLAKAVHVYDVEEVHWNESWGRSWSRWIEGRGPSWAIPVYHGQDETKVSVTVSTEDGLVVNSFDSTMAKGLNYPRYDLSISDDKVKAYEKALNKALDKDQPTITLKKAENGKYYLRAGQYTIRVSSGGASAETTLSIK